MFYYCKINDRRSLTSSLRMNKIMLNNFTNNQIRQKEGKQVEKNQDAYTE